MDDFATYGIVFPQYDDSNDFHGVYLTSGVNGAVGVELNDQCGGTCDGGGYGEDFYGATVDMVGASSYAVVVNKTTPNGPSRFFGEIGVLSGGNILVQNSGQMVFQLSLGPQSGGTGFIAQACSGSPSSGFTTLGGLVTHC